MEQIGVFLGFLLAMVMLVALARRLKIPYPILLVLGGTAIGFIPGLPTIEIDPHIILILFLPPILQYAAFLTPMRDFRANLRAIGLLSIGLVLVTMLAVAVVGHMVVGLPWAAAFVLGAIVAPPDAVAATSIARRLRLPRRIVTVLEGESLLNDATALVAYRVAVATVVTGTFSWADAGSQFFLASVGGVAVGIICGLVVTPIFRRLVDDVPVYLVFTFLSGYGAYLLAEELHVSGVLAVVALGFLYSSPRFNTMTPTLRLEGGAIWEIVTFVLNGLIFILIGLELRDVVRHMTVESIVQLSGYAAIICVTVIVVRFVWVFPGTYLPRLSSSVREREPFPPRRHVAIVAWTGMRGLVSLATALALPLTVEGGALFPQRDLIIFLTFAVILATLVLQGLSLPLIIRGLRVVDDGRIEHEENQARLRAAEIAQARLDEIAHEQALPQKLVEKIKVRYTARIKRYSARTDGNGDTVIEEKFISFEQLERDLLEVEHIALIQMRNENKINDEVLRRIQRDLDLEWSRLSSAERE